MVDVKLLKRDFIETLLVATINANVDEETNALSHGFLSNLPAFVLG